MKKIFIVTMMAVVLTGCGSSKEEAKAPAKMTAGTETIITENIEVEETEIEPIEINEIKVDEIYISDDYQKELEYNSKKNIYFGQE